MRKEYDLNLIRDYVEGNDIEEYDIDELENDYRFMISVIKYTKDKNMYNLCSDIVKNNYEFVKFIINYFKDDIEFIDVIAENYLLNHKDNSYDYMDISINMININKNNIEHYNKYYLLAKLFYFRHMVEIKLGIQEANVVSELGEGFLIVQDDFKGNKDILDFFTINLINDILFEKEDFDLEKEIHKEYDSFNEIDKNGLNNYMIELLSGYDKYLSGYVSNHLDTLDNLREVLLEIKDNWNKFLDNNERIRYELIVERIHSYLLYCETYCTLGEIEVLCFIGNDFGIEKQIIEYAGISEDLYQEFIDSKSFFMNNMSNGEKIHYKNIKNIVNNILSEKIVDDSINNYTSDNKSKVLRVDFKNKKVNNK